MNAVRNRLTSEISEKSSQRPKCLAVQFNVSEPSSGKIRCRYFTNHAPDAPCIDIVDTHLSAWQNVATTSIREGNYDMRTVVKKWGNSASVRIPAAVMQAAHLDLDEAVDVREESGRIVIEPAQRKEYDLAELLKGITRENLHDEADFGRPVGKEAL